MFSALSHHIAVIGAGASAFAPMLARHFADVIVLPPYSRLDPRVASHPDMLLMSLGRDVVIPASYGNREDVYPILDVLRSRCGVRLILSERSPGDTYPHDVVCNALFFGIGHNKQTHARFGHIRKPLFHAIQRNLAVMGGQGIVHI